MSVGQSLKSQEINKLTCFSAAQPFPAHFAANVLTRLPFHRKVQRSYEWG